MGGLTFRTETGDEIRHFWPVYNELDNLTQFASDLRPNDVVFDVGAHVGVYSVTAARADVSEVYAFEPLPANVERVRENATLNGVDVRTFGCGLSDRTTTQGNVVGGSKSGSLLHISPDGNGDETVPLYRGEDIVTRHDLPLPTVVKLDIEGAELRALEGLDGVLEECRLIHCEVSERLAPFGDSPARLHNWLTDRGFAIESLGRGGVGHGDIRAIR
ncbi:hypothetical protein C474_09112 [Halogeometricum pallidum JCM 14848]|uniref:Methyltransferase FkbM domain-containing protein n=1 Tax=Halogeometricum pallidum JCM 14848 TaxID=1227487 RepID=M0D9F4_HALPD|nr:FkbM family methyltransferase [Halogeometricum pallidum]ELZ31448.1 hypothetical protein C474_09112 [Halogeometricum pallidum JCM 14848]